MTVTPEMTARCLMMAGQKGRCNYEKEHSIYRKP
nr:MAG TPA: hypothetical protein [Caudoviricetes sp.]